MLQNKSLVQLRGIAQSYGIADIFQKDEKQLVQSIELKQRELEPKPKVEVPKPEYDARLMTQPPAKIGEVDEITQLIDPYIKRGLHFSTDAERWYMRHGIKTDEGTLRMPMRTIIFCADRIMEK